MWESARSVCCIRCHTHSFTCSFLVFKYLLKINIFTSGLKLNIREICSVGFSRHLGERHALDPFE